MSTNVISFLDDINNETAITLTLGQEEALAEMMDFTLGDTNQKFHVLTGGPGTGKSELIKFYRKEAESHGFCIIQTATTNKAVMVLNEKDEAAEESAMTIHSFLQLKIKANFNTGKEDLVKSGSKSNNPNPYTISKIRTIIVVDEASMLSTEMMVHIEESGCRYLLVGDDMQLPPVGETESLAFSSGYPTSELTQIMRQAASNPILKTAALYREAIETNAMTMPPIANETFEGGGITYMNRANFDATIIKCFKSDKAQADINYARVICWRNDTVNLYNSRIRSEAFGYPEEPQLGEVYGANSQITSVSGDLLFRNAESLTIDGVGRVNQNGVDCYRVTTVEKGDTALFSPVDKQVFVNRQKEIANQAKIYKAKANSHANDPDDKDFKKYTLAAKGEWGKYFFLKGSIGDIRPQYAQTCHRSQGSTYEVVFIRLDDITLNRNFNEMLRLVYVSLTRTRQRVFITW